MIILDTHIWVWWMDENPSLLKKERDIILGNQSDGLGISAFSLWEVAKLYEKQRITFTIPLNKWFSKALERPDIVLLPISPDVIVESVELPDEFHNDPADQIIVATARVYDCPLITYDSKILTYKHVKLLS